MNHAFRLTASIYWWRIKGKAAVASGKDIHVCRIFSRASRESGWKARVGPGVHCTGRKCVWRGVRMQAPELGNIATSLSAVARCVVVAARTCGKVKQEARVISLLRGHAPARLSRAGQQQAVVCANGEQSRHCIVEVLVRRGIDLHHRCWRAFGDPQLLAIGERWRMSMSSLVRRLGGLYSVEVDERLRVRRGEVGCHFASSNAAK